MQRIVSCRSPHVTIASNGRRCPIMPRPFGIQVRAAHATGQRRLQRRLGMTPKLLVARRGWYDLTSIVEGHPCRAESADGRID
jgi:hypothetical protein